MVLCKFSRKILNGLSPDDLDSNGPHSLIWILPFVISIISGMKVIFFIVFRQLTNFFCAVKNTWQISLS